MVSRQHQRRLAPVGRLTQREIKMHEFAKPIKTVTQSFKVGDTVTPQDDLAPHDFNDLLKRGFIKELPDEAKAAPAKKGALLSGAPLDIAT